MRKDASIDCADPPYFLSLFLAVAPAFTSVATGSGASGAAAGLAGGGGAFGVLGLNGPTHIICFPFEIHTLDVTYL